MVVDIDPQRYGFFVVDKLPDRIEYAQGPSGMLPRDFEPNVRLVAVEEGSRWVLFRESSNQFMNTQTRKIAEADSRTEADFKLHQHMEKNYAK